MCCQRRRRPVSTRAGFPLRRRSRCCAAWRLFDIVNLAPAPRDVGTHRSVANAYRPTATTGAGMPLSCGAAAAKPPTPRNVGTRRSVVTAASFRPSSRGVAQSSRQSSTVTGPGCRRARSYRRPRARVHRRGDPGRFRRARTPLHALSRTISAIHARRFVRVSGGGDRLISKCTLL